MKVVQITAIDQYKSTGRTTTEMHEFLKKAGIQSFVFCMNDSNPSDNIYKVGNVVYNKIHGLLSRITGLAGYYSYVPTIRLLKQLDKIGPDIVILRMLHSNFIQIPMLLHYLARKDIATVVVLHDCWFFTGHCVHYTKYNCSRWKNECHHCPDIKNGCKSWFFDTSHKVFHDRIHDFNQIPRLAVIGVSSWIANEASYSPILGNAKINKFIYNWVDLEKFYPRDGLHLRKSLCLDNKFIVLGVSSVWDENKGICLFIDIAKRNPDIAVALVGEVPNRYSIPSNVVPLGSTTSIDDLAAYYSMADVFVSPSVQESFGKVIAESLACGTPAIVNNVTGMPELVSDGCGYTVDNNNIDDFCKHVLTIRANGKSFYSQACLSKAQKSFDKEKNMRKYISLFNELSK